MYNSGSICIIVGVSIPPPFLAEILRTLAGINGPFPRHSTVVDFNNYLDHVWDILPPLPNYPLSRRTYPFCLSSGGARTDRCVEDAPPQNQNVFVLLLGNDPLLPVLAYSQYEIRHISDHSLFWVELSLPASPRNFGWKLNPFWLSLFLNSIPELITTLFWQNLNIIELGTVRDVAKTFLRGQLINLISHIKTKTKAWETFIITEAQKAEEAYVANSSDATKWTWWVAQSMSRW